MVADGTGTITTFAGSGQLASPANEAGKPALSVPVLQPLSLAFDGSDNLYMLTSEWQITGLQKVSASTGLISTAVLTSVLTNFLTAFPGVQATGAAIGMAVDKAGSNLWLALSGQVLKIALGSGTVTTFPTGNSQYSAVTLAPNGDAIYLAVPAGGNVYNPSIVRVSSTGAISTVFSSPLSAPVALVGALLPTALCTGSSGDIFLAEASSTSSGSATKIFMIDGKTGAASQVAATSSVLGTIVGNSIATDAAGNLYFSEADATVHRMAAAAAGSPRRVHQRYCLAESCRLGAMCPWCSRASGLHSMEQISARWRRGKANFQHRSAEST